MQEGERRKRTSRIEFDVYEHEDSTNVGEDGREIVITAPERRRVSARLMNAID